MIFNSTEYAVFLPIVLLLYYRLAHRQQNVLLLIASYIFYGAWDARFLVLIMLSTVIDYSIGLWMERAHQANDAQQAKRALVVSVVTNLGILGFFKYFNFFIDSFRVMSEALGFSASLPTLYIILPVGVSFYTFQSLSYTIDVYRRRLKATNSLLEFAVFVSIFPQLVAGPIERAVELLPQIQRQRVVTQEHLDRGCYLILVGLIRKVAIADVAGMLADRYFSNPGQYSSLELMMALVLYALQIYGDFAGYTDIARGSALLLGFDLMRNFRHPYFSQNMTEFWQRWHISLSTWLRDYLYIPLGGNRKGPVRTYINLMMTMLLGGLWHGASWNFVFWGFLHGLCLVVHRLFRNRWPQGWPLPGGWGVVQRSLNGMMTFAVVVFTWLFFRVTDLTRLGIYLQGLAKLDFSSGQHLLAPLFLLLVMLLLIDIPQARTDDEFYYLRYPPLMRGLLVSEGLLILFALGGGRGAPFIYFQF